MTGDLFLPVATTLYVVVAGVEEGREEKGDHKRMNGFFFPRPTTSVRPPAYE